MTSRRDFLRKATLIASGIVAADQLEILDRIGWTRTLFPSVALDQRFTYELGFLVTEEMLEDMMVYPAPDIARWRTEILNS